MRARFRSDADGWSADGRKITSADNLNSIRGCLENEGPIIVEHWFYRGSSAPDRIVFDNFESFEKYLNTRAFAGDVIHVWSFASVCRDDNELAHGKCPDDEGMVPKDGAY